MKYYCNTSWMLSILGHEHYNNFVVTITKFGHNKLKPISVKASSGRSLQANFGEGNPSVIIEGLRPH